jgi:tetratricopeptide (TPR) repeat protein
VEKGQYDLGLQVYRAALAIYEKVGAQAELVEALHDSARLHLLLGDSASAERDFRRALEMARTIGLGRGITRNLISLGDVEFRRKQPDAAVALYEQARQRAAAASEQHALALSLLRLARVNRSQQRVALASAETDQSLVIAREIGAPGLEAEALRSGIGELSGGGKCPSPDRRPGSPLADPVRSRAADSASLGSALRQ